MNANTQLNLEAGNLTTWANNQALRLSKLRTFQPKGWTCVGYSRAIKGLKNAMRAAGVTGSQLNSITHDIVDMAQLYAIAA
jgi:hypothetical protein